MDRRAFLLLSAAGLLSACAAERAQPAPPAAAPPSTSPVAPPASPPRASPTPSIAQVSREEIVARYTGVVPATWGLDGPGIVRRLPTQDRVVALTFDACGGARGSGYDAALIDVLRSTGTPATLFLNQRWILAFPDLAAELAAEPLFELANHGTRHMPLSVDGRSAYGIPGTAAPGEVYDEIHGNRQTLTALTGAPPHFFRSGTAHYDDVAVRIAGDLGETVVNFDVNGDAGATSGPQQVSAALLTAKPGSIVLAHMNQPSGGTAEGVAAALPRLTGAGYRFVRLSEYLA